MSTDTIVYVYTKDKNIHNVIQQDILKLYDVSLGHCRVLSNTSEKDGWIKLSVGYVYEKIDNAAFLEMLRSIAAYRKFHARVIFAIQDQVMRYTVGSKESFFEDVRDRLADILKELNNFNQGAEGYSTATEEYDKIFSVMCDI